MLKERNYQSRILYPAKLYFSNAREVKKFPDKQKQAECTISNKGVERSRQNTHESQVNKSKTEHKFSDYAILQVNKINTTFKNSKLLDCSKRKYQPMC